MGTFKLRSWWITAAVLLFSQVAIAQIWTEDFEVDGEGVTYTSSNFFNDGTSDHFQRTDGSNISNVSGAYSGQSGTFFWAGEDLDDLCAVPPCQGDGLVSKTVTFAAINVTGIASLEFRGLFATGNIGNGWDSTDEFYVEYNMDGAGWVKLMQFAAPGAGTNLGMNYDANLDGIGEGVQITNVFQLFTAAIPATGNSLEIRVFMRADSASEEAAFDNFQVYDTSVATPGCTDPLADNYDPAATVDDGSCLYNGCTDPSALNYDAGANNDDGSCIYTLPNIVITEIHYNSDDVSGFPDANYEFLEIYNADAVTVDLTDWSFFGVTFTFPAASSIAPGEYIVITIDPASYVGAYQTFQFTGALGNSGETVQLIESNGLVVDEVTYGDVAPWNSAADGTGPSLELINIALDNALAPSWCANGPVNGTPGAASSCAAPITPGCTDAGAFNYDPVANQDDGSCVYAGCTNPAAINYDPIATIDDGSCVFNTPDIVINEIHYNPCTAQGDDTFFEFIELYNNEGVAVDISDWVISGAVDFTFPAGTSMAAGEYIVITVNAASYAGNGYQVFQFTGGMNNTGETITLSTADPAIVDQVGYSDQLPWPMGADGGCPSLELIDPNTDNADGNNWQDSYVPNGTPGAPNSTAPVATAYTIVECQTGVAATGEFVSTTGIVTAVYAANLFTIQDGFGPYTGIWVEGSGVALGDEVDVQGFLTEDFGLTILTNTAITLLSSANPLPANQVLGTLAVNDEQWEGVLVETTGDVAVGDAGFGEWSIDDASGQIFVDDLGVVVAPANVGDTYTVIGPLYYSFNVYKIEPRDINDVLKWGCTDPLFPNYDPVAVIDDGSCGIVPGCTNPAADNYDPAATIDDGSCIISGCTDAGALNYDPAANNDDGSCYFTLPNLVINEIHYNPCDAQVPDDFTWEFLEIYNAEASTVDLAGYTFSQGITFTFQPGDQIAAGEYIILAVTSASYVGNGYQVFQITAGNFGNAGETVELQDAFGNTIDIVTYDDVAPWPTSPDGFCPSLELIDPSLDNSIGSNWQGSWVDYGTPGAPNSTPPPATPVTIVEAQTVTPAGTLISTTGVVTAVYASNLYTIQNGIGAYTGIWVSGAGVSLGDNVTVEGLLSEPFGLTLITQSSVVINSSGNALPQPIVLGTLPVNDEQWEGVLITTTAPVSNGNVGFGEWAVNDGTGQALSDDLGVAVTPLTVGVKYTVVGPLYYSFNAYKLEPRDLNDIQEWGCTDVNACNYSATAVIEDGSCDYSCTGCTDPGATNYDAAATIDDGSCFIAGCTYMTADNYDPTATLEDGSCTFTLANDCPADLNGDNLVNTGDLVILLSAFGTTCP